MKFEDIEKVPYAYYQSHPWLGDFDKYIERLVSSFDLNLTPDFQRGRVWTCEQRSSYMEHILRGNTSAIEIKLNHPGWMKDFNGEFVCLDGLQRITAILGFLNNEVKAFGHYYRDFTDSIPLDINVLVQIYNMKTRAEILKWYINFNSGGTPHTKEEIERVHQLLTKEMHYE